MKIGLILEGGASRTYFTCGILDALLEGEIYADYVVGTSAGIAYGVSYCSRQKGRNLEILEKYVADKRYMGIRHMLNRKNGSYYNLDFVFGDIPKTIVPFDYDVFDTRTSNSVAVVTDIETGKPEYLEMPVDKDFMLLRATCALPILFRPIEIGGKKYMDGGLSDSIPFMNAVENGCDKNIVILTRPRSYRKQQEKSAALMKLFYRKYPLLTQCIAERPERYNAQLDLLAELEKDGRALVLAPEDTHGIGRTEKNPKVLIPFYKEGYEYGMGMLDAIRNYLA